MPNSQWSFVLDGFNDVYLAAVAVDSLGNTYVAANYTSNYTIPVLNKKLPYAPHVHGLIIKLNQKGKPLWAHPFKSSFDNRIRAISIAPNGDLLITGFGDGPMKFPSLKDTISVGKLKDKGQYHHNQGVYVARYTPEGNCKWVKYHNTPWGEGISIAANQSDEVFMYFYFKGKLAYNGKVLDSIPKAEKVESKQCLAIFSGDGKLKEIRDLGYNKSASYIIRQHLKFDNQDNLLLFGTYQGILKLTAQDSLVSDQSVESLNSYIAKYNPEGELLWLKNISGRNTQIINDLVVGPDNSIYATGDYNFECILGDAINVDEKTKFEWKSGSSLFYFHLFENGALDFVRFEDNKGYSSYVHGRSIALDQNNAIHIVGTFNDTVRIDGKNITAWHHNHQGHYMLWGGENLKLLEKVGDAPKGFMSNIYLAINQKYMAGGGEYYGDDAYLFLNDKKLKLSNKDYGRVCFVYGGIIPDQEKPKPALVSFEDRKLENVSMLKPLVACIKPNDEPKPDLWFVVDTLSEISSRMGNSTCGNAVKGMEAILFPNPTNGALTVRLKGLTEGVTIEVFTEGGQLLFSQKIEALIAMQDIKMNVSNWSSGFYFVRISNSQYQKALKFVKVN